MNILKFIISITAFSSPLLYAQPKILPECPANHSIQQVNSSLIAIHNKSTKLYDVNSKNVVFTKVGKVKMSWTIVEENISAKSTAEAISKAKKYLTQIQGSPRKDIYRGYRGGDNIYPDTLTWTCTWRAKNSSREVIALAITRGQ